MKKTILSIAMALIGMVSSRADEPPMAPPQGYTWAPCPEIKGYFLKPNSWHLKKSKKGDTLAVFITKEMIGETGKFTTGMTVNVIPDIPKRTSLSPHAFARQFRESARKSATFTKEWDKDMGPFKSVGFVYSKEDKAGAFTVHNLLIANNKTGTVYLVMFEGPKSEWAKTWEIAEPMLQCLYIDDTI